MIPSLRRMAYGFIAAFAIVALAAGYWVLVRGNTLLDDENNPRRVLAEQQIERGDILDRHGEVLAGVVMTDSGIVQRVYPHVGVSPVLGYYSLRYGVGGIEAAYDDLLRGDLSKDPEQQVIDELLHHAPVGGDVRLTIDLAVQQAAMAALDGYKGAIVILRGGEVLALASTPDFDPNTLDEMWDSVLEDPDAPLLNRATQGLYQPGTILQSVVLGTALNYNTAAPYDTWSGPLTLPVDGVVLPCAGQTGTASTLAAAFMAGCPVPFQSVAEQLGAERLDRALEDFGLLDAPAFTLPVESAGLDAPPAAADLSATAIGQSDLTVSPLQMALIAATFAHHGQQPPLQLVLETRLPGKDWVPVEQESTPKGILSRASADAVAALMRQSVADGPNQAASIPGYQVYGHTGIAVAGPEGVFNVWFIGFVPSVDGNLISVAVLLEGTSDAATATRIGGQALDAALQARP